MLHVAGIRPCEKTTMHYGPKQKKTQKISHHSLSHERGSERSKLAKRARQSKQRVSDVRKQANEQGNGPALTSGFMVILDHSAMA